MLPITRTIALLMVIGLALPAWGQAGIPQSGIAQRTLQQARLDPVTVKNGVLRRKAGRDAIAPLKIETPDSADYVLKLVNTQTGNEEMLIYVARKSMLETKVPLGTYIIRGAFGATWYGERNLFGPETSYFRLAQKHGASDQFSFRRTGNQVNGYVVQLIQQVAGNLETPGIKADEF